MVFHLEKWSNHDCNKIQPIPSQVKVSDAQFIWSGEANRKQLQIFSF